MQEPSEAEIITSASRLEAVVKSALEQPRVALDLESNGFYSYRERICLVQLAVGDKIYLIDPLQGEGVAPLGELLAAPSVEKIFHSADYDVRSLDRDWGFRIRGLFDTSIAAAFIGSDRLGLAATLKKYLKIEITKKKSLQRANWAKRPLTPDLLQYAAGDVRYLDRLRTTLHRRLKRRGRTQWVEEEAERLAAIRHSPPEPVKNAFLSTKGSKDLDGRGLAILRSIHAFREKEARRRDKPPFMIFSDSLMVEMATNPDLDLEQTKGLGIYVYPPRSDKLRRAIRAGQNANPVRRPPAPASPRPRLSTSARKKLSALKEWRGEHAAQLKINPGLVWPAPSLTRLATRPDSFADEMESPEVRKWQRRELEASLRAFVQESLGDTD